MHCSGVLHLRRTASVSELGLVLFRFIQSISFPGHERNSSQEAPRGPGEPDGGDAPSDPNSSGHGKDGCDPTTSAKLALQLRATQLGHAQLGGPQGGGAQLSLTYSYSSYSHGRDITVFSVALLFSPH